MKRKIQFCALLGWLLLQPAIAIAQTDDSSEEAPEQTQTAPDQSTPNPSTDQDPPNQNAADQTVRSQSITGAQSLADQREDEAIWLDLNSGKVLALNQPHLSASSKGAFVIMTATPLSKTPLGMTHTLRLTLPYQGWQTLAVDTSSIALSDTADVSVAGDTSPQHYTPQIITAVIKHLTEQGVRNIVFMTDNRLADAIIAKLSSDAEDASKQEVVRAVVILNTLDEDKLSSAALRSLFKNKQLPVIDVFVGGRQRELTQDMARHKGVAKSQKLENYSQLQLIMANRTDNPDHYNAITNRIRGALDRVAKGVEIQINNQ